MEQLKLGVGKVHRLTHTLYVKYYLDVCHPLCFLIRNQTYIFIQSPQLYW